MAGLCGRRHAHPRLGADHGLLKGCTLGEPVEGLSFPGQPGLSQLRRAQVGNQRVPHKPLLLLWLFGRFATTDTTLVSYREAEDPVSRLISDFGAPAP